MSLQDDRFDLVAAIEAMPETWVGDDGQEWTRDGALKALMRCFDEWDRTEIALDRASLYRNAVLGLARLIREAP